MLPLDLMRSGEWGEVTYVSGEPGWVGRLAELGIRPGCRLQVVQAGSPCLLNIAGCRLCLRPNESACIFVNPLSHGMPC